MANSSTYFNQNPLQSTGKNKIMSFKNFRNSKMNQGDGSKNQEMQYKLNYDSTPRILTYFNNNNGAPQETSQSTTHGQAKNTTPQVPNAKDKLQ